MLTYGNLIARLRPLIWPAGEAPNLVAAHDQCFVDCLDDLQTWVDCLKVDHYDLIPHCATLYNCGLTMFEQPPHSEIKRLSVIDKQSTLESGTVTASKVGNLVTANEAFFERSMVGNVIKFANGEGFVVLAYIDPTKILVVDPGIITNPFLYLSTRFRINQTTGLPEWFDDTDQAWHAVEVIGGAGEVQIGPEQTGTP